MAVASRRQALLSRAALAARRPGLVDLIGPPPLGPAQRDGWGRAAGAVLAYRERPGNTEAGLGPEPDRPPRVRIRALFV